jgi:hypothetical protein
VEPAFTSLSDNGSELLARETIICDGERQCLTEEFNEALSAVTCDNVDTCLLFGQLFPNEFADVPAFLRALTNAMTRLFGVTYLDNVVDAGQKIVQNFVDKGEVLSDFPPFTSASQCLLFLCTWLVLRTRSKFTEEVKWP